MLQPDDTYSDYYVVEDEEANVYEQRFTGLLQGLHAKSGQTVEEFRQWVLRASWVDIPALQVVES